jgi:hypothetical protein
MTDLLTPVTGIDDLILGVEKPSRYMGGELNAVVKNPREARMRFGLCFPDMYEVGMSNVGFRTLYHALNERPDTACERFFMPWADLEAQLRSRGLPLFSLENRLPARAFDVLQALAERSDRVVSKAELLDLAWPGLVVEENNLTVQISALRRLLGHESIATVTGRGYRLTLARQDSPAQPDTGMAAPAGRLLRRLATVVQADVVGWARMVERDAPGATRVWKRTRTELIERDVPRYGGRLIELTAERVQIEFSSAVESVDWSLALQAMAKATILACH